PWIGHDARIGQVRLEAGRARWSAGRRPAVRRLRLASRVDVRQPVRLRKGGQGGQGVLQTPRLDPAGMTRSPALDALDRAGLGYRLIRHGPVGSLIEAAAARGVAVEDVVKTIVVRRGEADFLFILV